MKKFITIAAGIAALVMPSSALAHSVQAADASCTAGVASLVDFGEVDTNIRVSVLENGTVIGGPVTVNSPAGSQLVPVGYKSPLAAGNHTVTVRVTWNHGDSPQTADKEVYVKGCPAPVVTPVVTPPVVIQLPGTVTTVPSAPVVQTVSAPVSAPVVLTPKHRAMKCERRFNKRHRLVIVCVSKKAVKAKAKRGPATKHAKRPGQVSNPQLTG